MVWELHMNAAVIFSNRIPRTVHCLPSPQLVNKTKQNKTKQSETNLESRERIEKHLASLKDSWDRMAQPSIHMVRAPEEEEKERGTQKHAAEQLIESSSG